MLSTRDFEHADIAICIATSLGIVAPCLPEQAVGQDVPGPLRNQIIAILILNN